MAVLIDNKCRLRTIFCLMTVLTFTVKCNAATIDDNTLPLLCDTVKCPPMSELHCPEDSDIRETLNTVELFPANVPTTEAAAASAFAATYNASAIPDELFAQCCLAPKCLCRTCYIQDCHQADEVVIELQPEAMDTPGHCCGQHECMPEPNCTVVRDTEHYWLRDCQRCKCYSGSRICHVSCDETIAKEPTAICKSKNLNTFYKHGDSWRDGCYECECVNGEEKCTMPFCKSVNCPTQRQVILKDSCCPICWPKGIPMPNINDDPEDAYDENADDGNDYENDNDNDDDDDMTLPPLLKPVSNENDNEIAKLNTTAAPDNLSDSTISTSTVANKPEVTSDAPIFAVPCQDTMSAKYKIQIDENFEQQQHSHLYFYIVIVILFLVVIALLGRIIVLHNRQRSYRPVSKFDDNFNKMTSTTIKKVNEYA